MHFRVRLNRSWWVQCSILCFDAGLRATSLRGLVLVVLEGEEVRHVVRGDLHLARTTGTHLVVHHGLALKVSSHVYTLNVNRLRHTIYLLVVRIHFVRYIICSCYIDL